MTAGAAARGASSREELGPALASLYARVPLGMRLGLEPMRAACEAFGHPERAFPAVHVAGTNGKGSVCAMVESIARAAGMRTGLYTSPHLCRFAERIRIDGRPLADDELAPLLESTLARAPDLSFFETATLAAFVAFRAAKVDVAVLEVGLGGRLDATNVIPPPRAAAITRIALDHEDRLGPTLAHIAREKAGIAKAGLEIVLGPMQPDVRAVLEAEARARGAAVVDADRHAAAAPAKLPGIHQQDNAAVAFALGRRIGASEEACARGIRDAEWPGRLERIDAPDGPFLLDAAHNPDGVEALVRYLEGRKVGALLFGTLIDKAWPEMLDRLAPVAARRVYLEPRGGRPGADPRELAARHAGHVAASVPEGLALARRLREESGDGRALVVIAGSLLLVGEARAELLGLPRDPPVAL